MLFQREDAEWWTWYWLRVDAAWVTKWRFISSWVYILLHMNILAGSMTRICIAIQKHVKESTSWPERWGHTAVPSGACAVEQQAMTIFTTANMQKLYPNNRRNIDVAQEVEKWYMWRWSDDDGSWCNNLQTTVQGCRQTCVLKNNQYKSSRSNYLKWWQKHLLLCSLYTQC